MWRPSLRNVVSFHLPASVLTPCLIGMGSGDETQVSGTVAFGGG